MEALYNGINISLTLLEIPPLLGIGLHLPFLWCYCITGYSCLMME